MYVTGGDETVETLELFADVIKDELNVKTLEAVKDDSKFNDEFLSVNFKKAGAVLKGDVQKLKVALSELSEEEIKQAVKGFKAGKVNIGSFKNLNSDLFNLEKKPKSEFVISHENGITVVLDITIDEELFMEGLYRELVRGLQVLRKEADFAIDDRIVASFETTDEKLKKVLKIFAEKIKQEVLIIRAVEKIEKPDIEKNVEVGDSFIIVKFAKKI